MTGILKKINKEKILATALFLSIAVKFINLGIPIFEGAVGRQIATAVITRNIFRGGSIFLPQLDTAPFPHYCMLEFPIYNIFVSGFYGLFGINEISGRVVSILSIILATFFIFKLVKKYFNLDTALLSGIFFNLSPIALIYARSYQPDPMMISAILGGFYFLDLWASTDKKTHLFVSSIFFLTAFLIKVIALYVFIPILFLFALKERGKFLGKYYFWIFVMICLLPVAAWYLHARSIALSPQFFRATTDNTSVWDVFSRWIVPSCWLNISYYKTFFKIFTGPLLTPLGFTFFILGVLRRSSDARQLFFHVYLLALLFYSFLLLRKMDLEYYYLAYLPVVSVFTARGVESFMNLLAMKKEFFFNKLSILFLSALGLVLVFTYSYRGYVVPDYLQYARKAADILKKNTKADDLVIASAPVMYYADRKGFQIYYEPEHIGQEGYTWEARFKNNSPEELLRFYISQDGVAFAETLSSEKVKYSDFFDHVRKKYRTIDYRKNQYLISDLTVK